MCKSGFGEVSVAPFLGHPGDSAKPRPCQSWPRGTPKLCQSWPRALSEPARRTPPALSELARRAPPKLVRASFENRPKAPPRCGINASWIGYLKTVWPDLFGCVFEVWPGPARLQKCTQTNLARLPSGTQMDIISLMFRPLVSNGGLETPFGSTGLVLLCRLRQEIVSESLFGPVLLQLRHGQLDDLFADPFPVSYNANIICLENRFSAYFRQF